MTMETTAFGDLGPATPGGGERVLFIEDSPTLAQLLEVSLVQAGYEVQRASSGEEGLELARANPPELLLCDVMLPGIDGFEVVRVLRHELATANISIIMLTAMANVMEGLDAGADDYVLKPYDHRELLARARSVLRRAKAMRALSPLTGLPGNTRIQEELERAIQSGRRFPCSMPTWTTSRPTTTTTASPAATTSCAWRPGSCTTPSGPAPGPTPSSATSAGTTSWPSPPRTSPGRWSRT
jgi:CheY-like chemotaxis protein